MSTRPLAALALLALLAAGCGGDSDAAVATGEPAPTATTAPESDDQGPPDPAAESEGDRTGDEEPTAVPEPTATPEPAPEPAEGFPVVVAADNGPVEVTAPPERIVSLSTVSTETLFAIGAGDQVLAVDSQSNHPPEAPITDLSSFTPSIEAIAELEPDLVFLSFDPGDVIAGLETLGIPTILHGTALTLDQAFTQIEQTGAAVGRVGDAAELVAAMQADIDAAVASAPVLDPAPRIFHEVSFDLYSSTSSTFIGQLYALFGLENIADAADEEGFGFPQLSPEYVLEQDPDIIFLGDVLYGENLDSLAARPGWDALTAIQSGAVVELDTDVASRWGPRVPQLVEAIAAALIEYEAQAVS